MTNAPNQDVLHRRLRAAMDRPENQSCCDCGDPKPTWASIIVPPTSVPAEVSAQPMGALCCFHCSGAHRRLGVHICFVRSVTLDDWKEKEVVAVELGGNKRVNRAFEARLSSRRAATEKPTSKSDLEMRDRFVKAKYRDHKYFDPTKYATENPPTPIKQEPDIDPTLFHGMESVNLFSPTQISKYVDATATTNSHNIPNIHADDDKINPAEEAEIKTVKRQTSMESESSDRVDRKDGNGDDDPTKPVYFLPLRKNTMESTEQPAASQGRGPSHHSRSRTSRDRDERSSSRSRARRSSRSHDSSCEDDGAEKTTGRRSLRRSNSKSPKRSSSQSRRNQLKQSRSKRHVEGSQSQEKEESKTTTNLQRSTRGSAEGTETSAPMRRNLSGPSVANVSLTPTPSSGQNGSATLIRKSSSLLSLSAGSGSNLRLAQQEMSSLRNATFSPLPADPNSKKLNTLTSTFEQAQRLASEYIIQELAKIQVSSQGNNVTKQGSSNVRSNDTSKPASNRRASVSKSPPRTSLSGRRAKSRHSSSPEVEPKREETSTSGRRSAEQVVDESNMEEERNKPSSYLSVLNDELGDEYNSTNNRGQETSDEVPGEIGGLTTMRVASKYALAEMEEMQNSFQQDPAEKPIRRSTRRMPTSSRRNTQRHPSRSRSRGSTGSRSPSSSPSDPNRTRLSISRSPSTDLESRHSESKTPPPPTGDEEENNEFIVPLSRTPGRKLERTHSHGSSTRRMIRQASSRDVPGEQKSLNPNTPPGSRPLSRRSMADDTNQSENGVDNTTNEFQPRGSIGPPNRALRTNRVRRDPLSSKSDHQARSRGRVANRVDAANQKTAIELSSMTQTRPAPPSRTMLARTASMSILDAGGGGGNLPQASGSSQEVATPAAVAAAVPGPTRRMDDRNSLSGASSHGNHPRSNRMLDRNGLGSASSHGVNPRMLRGKTAATSTKAASSGNDRVLQLFAAAGPPKDDGAATSINDDDEEALINSAEGAERRTKALSAAALKAMKELKQITG